MWAAGAVSSRMAWLLRPVTSRRGARLWGWAPANGSGLFRWRLGSVPCSGAGLGHSRESGVLGSGDYHRSRAGDRLPELTGL